jgi:hypothetical protein
MPPKRAKSKAQSSFERQKKQIKAVINKFGVKPGRSRVGLI